MAKAPHWKQHLIGSLAGQLQLATFLMVFAGFTAASSLGLLMGKQNLFANEERLAEESIEHCEHSIKRSYGDPIELEKGLLFHSTTRTQFWIERKNGELIIPDMHGSFPSESFLTAMASNPKRIAGKKEILTIGQTTLLTNLAKEFDDGSRLWIITNISPTLKSLNTYLILTIAIWLGILAITLTATNLAVRSIIRPLNQLNIKTTQLTAKNLESSKLIIKKAPIEIVQLGEAFNALSDRLALSWDQQKHFVSAVSHELRTPLTIVQGYIHRTIKRGDNLRESQIKGLQTAEEESIRMRRLLDDLLELSRSDSGRLEINNETVRIYDQAEEAIELARSSFKRPLLFEPQNQSAIKDLTVQADAHRLHQVLFDLIENANKYSAEGTTIKLVLRQDNDGIAIDVIDQGIGIPENEIDKVFDRFQRASNAPHKTGSGLGLSLVKLFVEGMGGRIEVSSRLGEGSCFTVHLAS